MKKLYILIIILLIVFLIIVIKNPSTNKNSININSNINEIYLNQTYDVITNIVEEPKKEVKIISHKKDYFSIDVVIKNNTGKTLNKVIVRAECYDEDGNNLGTYSNWQYNVNTTDNYKISIFCQSDTYKYKLKLEYE